MADKVRIVMIDDEPELCLLVKSNLEDTGEFEVTTTSDPLTAENLCLQQKPDLILLDNVMPGKKGEEIAKSLKKNPETKRIPIIVVSGKGEMIYDKKKKQFQWQPSNPMAKQRGKIIDEKSPERAAAAYGVEDYISKPFTTELLVEVIKGVLERCKKSASDEDEEPGVGAV